VITNLIEKKQLKKSKILDKDYKKLPTVYRPLLRIPSINNPSLYAKFVREKWK
jgi:hypothetical protein